MKGLNMTKAEQKRARTHTKDRVFALIKRMVTHRAPIMSQPQIANEVGSSIATVNYSISRLKVERGLLVERHGNRTRYGLETDKVRWSKWVSPHEAAGETSTESIRDCMCCQNSFMSEGAHNRLCGKCQNNGISRRSTFVIERSL